MSCISDSTLHSCSRVVCGEVEGFFSAGRKIKSPLDVESNHLAEVFHQKLADKNQIMRSPSLSVWSRDFKELLQWLMRRDRSNVLDASRLVEALIVVHVEHIRDKFWPKLRSAKALFEDYQKLEDAIQRWRGTESPSRRSDGRLSREETWG